MLNKNEIDSLKDAQNKLRSMKEEAEGFDRRLNIAEHKRLLRLLKMRLNGRITEEEMWAAVGGE